MLKETSKSKVMELWCGYLITCEWFGSSSLSPHPTGCLPAIVCAIRIISHKSEESSDIKFYGAEIRCKKAEKNLSLSLFCVLSVHCSLIFISAISSAWRESIYNRALCCCHSTKKRKNFVIPKHWKGVLLQLKFPPKKRIFLELSEMGKVDESACLHSTKQSRKVFQHPTLTLMKQHSSSSSESGNFYFIFFSCWWNAFFLPSQFHHYSTLLNEDLFVFQIQNARKCLRSLSFLPL